MRLIACLGTGEYKETIYEWKAPSGQTHRWETPYAPIASAHALDVEEIMILATREAREKHGAALEEAMAEAIPIRWVEIPTGASEEEMWQIYTAISENIARGETIALDVTHGFRSQPLIALLAISFLQIAHGIKVQHILYGAYEARDTSTTPPLTPVFDLAPMLDLLAWALAADRLIRQGDARDLAQRLREENLPYHVREDDPALKRLSKTIGEMAKSLDQVSNNLLLIRPNRAMAAAAKLSPRLSRISDLPPGARPYAELLDHVSETFAWLALPKPDAPANLWSNLARQRQLIRWYFERGHYLHAYILAREWLISWYLLHQGEADILKKEVREESEKVLNVAAHAYNSPAASCLSLWGVPADLNIPDLWNRIVQNRNALSHAVDRLEGDPAEFPQYLIEHLDDIIKDLERIALPSEATSQPTEECHDRD